MRFKEWTPVDYTQWHPWWAWHPVSVRTLRGFRTVWLETVERRAVYTGWDVEYEYSLPDAADDGAGV
jgi:hypothetical protein